MALPKEPAYNLDHAHARDIERGALVRRCPDRAARVPVARGGRPPSHARRARATAELLRVAVKAGDDLARDVEAPEAVADGDRELADQRVEEVHPGCVRVALSESELGLW